MPHNPFETHASVYDQWYEDFPAIFRSELVALRAILPPKGTWAEIGVGTGRFASELGIQIGIEPAESMAALARSRGINVIRGVAEAVPLESASLDAVFFITTLCFVENVQTAILEAYRVLKPAGHCIIGLLPRDSALGQATHAQAEQDLFFKDACLQTKAEVLCALETAGFSLQLSCQTLMGDPSTFASCRPVQEPGYDRGSFVVFRASKAL